MKLSDLKRLPIGTKLRLVHCLLGPCDKLREVAKLQSNAIAFKVEGKEELSWLYFPKAKDFVDDADGFTIMNDGEIGAKYKFV